MPLPGINSPKAAHEPTNLEQKLARVRDAMAKRASTLEKARSRARFLVGEIVLENPDLLALVASQFEPHLAKLGSARKAVDDYPSTLASLEQIKKLKL